MNNKLLYLATMSAALRASMADDGIQDMYTYKESLNIAHFYPGIAAGRRRRKSDNRCIQKKVEKRRKKNKNKKTHRK